jgi:hypothetical protein
LPDKLKSKNFVRLWLRLWKVEAIVGEHSLVESPKEVRQLNSNELSTHVENSQKRIEQGIASDQDYVVFIMCQLELAERGVIQG